MNPPYPWIDVNSATPTASLAGSIHVRSRDYLDAVGQRLAQPNAATNTGIFGKTAVYQVVTRICRMVEAITFYLDTLKSSGSQWLGDLYAPIIVRVSSKREVATSPVMLAVLAAEHCQADWTRRRFHDIHSAYQAQRILDDQKLAGGHKFPRQLVDIVSFLVGLKNIARTAVGPDKEIGVWLNGDLLWDDPAIAQCFATIVIDRWPENRDLQKSVVDALLLLAAGYEARQKEPAVVHLQEFEGFAARIKEFLRDEPGGGGARGVLFALEFGKFPFERFADRAAIAQGIAAHLIVPLTSGRPSLVWASLDRYWATMHPKELADHLKTSLSSVRWLQRWPTQPRRPRSFMGLLGANRMKLFRLKLEEDDAFEVITSQRPAANRDIWERITQVVNGFLQHRGPRSRVPTAFLARLLRILYYCYPKAMFELRVNGDEDFPELDRYTSLWLPRIPPSVDELQRLAQRGEYHHPKLLTARYAASMVMNRSIAFGYPARVFEAVEANTHVSDWLKVIDWVALMNAHSEWYKYLGKYRSAPPERPYCIPQRVNVHLVPDPLILACDIGASQVKVALFAYRTDHVTPDDLLARVAFPTRARDAQQYNGPAEFAERLSGDPSVQEAFSRVPDWRRRIVAVGLTWPGAVAGRPGLEYVAANSSALSYFAPFPIKKHWDAEAAQIRAFGLREAIEQHFQVDGRFPYVCLINDAVGHVLFDTWQLAAFPPRLREIVVGLTAGTGSGMAVLLAGSGPLHDILAEVGRLITHVSEPFPKSGDSPVGQGRDAFNSATLEKVAARLLTQYLIGPAIAPRFMASHPRVASHALALTLGYTPSGQVPAVLPLVPSLLISWLISADLNAVQADFEAAWLLVRPETCIASLDELRADLAAFLADTGSWSDPTVFAKEVVQHAGYELADLVATAAEIFGATSLITGGGPLSGYTGYELRLLARRELEDTYRYQVLGNVRPPLQHRIARLIRLPEPFGSPLAPVFQPAFSGAYGAAIAVVEMLRRAAGSS